MFAAYQRYLQMQTPLMPGDEFATPTSSGDATSSSSPPENATKANYSSDSDIEIVVCKFSCLVRKEALSWCN